MNKDLIEDKTVSVNWSIQWKKNRRDFYYA